MLPLVLCAVLFVSSSLADVTITNHWNGGFEATACIPFDRDVTGWTAHLKFDQDINSIEVWDAVPTKLSNREYKLVNMNWNGQQHPGDRVCFKFLGHGNGDITPGSQIYVEGGSGTGGGADPPSSGGSSAGSNPAPATGGGSDGTKNYGDALAKSILFYDTQRSGKLPANNPIPWRGDSAMGDCVTGGWYDAGDHVKFGLPMSSSAHLLTLGAIMFKAGYEKAGQMDMMYDMIRTPLDYFERAWNPGAQEFVAQIGDGNADHNYWGKPEDMHMYRPCMKISRGTHGSDITGESAAAMAAGSILFSQKDAAFSGKLLSAAKSLYEFAKNNRGVYTGSSPFYGSSGDKDEMCDAAIWLYKATKEDHYLNEAKSYASTGTAWSLSWDDKNLVCQLMIYSETQDGAYKGAVEAFFNSWMPGSGMTYTPCGLAWRDKWGSNRYAGNAAFGAMVAAELGIQSDKLRKWATEQINFLLGDNHYAGGCYSYEIGYGSKYPRHPHHRAASTNNKVLNGALVGGPDANGNFNDSQDDYVHNEVATDYNSGFQGALAGIVKAQADGKLPATNNKCPCKS